MFFYLLVFVLSFLFLICRWVFFLVVLFKIWWVFFNLFLYIDFILDIFCDMVFFVECICISNWLFFVFRFWILFMYVVKWLFRFCNWVFFFCWVMCVGDVVLVFFFGDVILLVEGDFFLVWVDFWDFEGVMVVIFIFFLLLI